MHRILVVVFAVSACAGCESPDPLPAAPIVGNPTVGKPTVATPTVEAPPAPAYAEREHVRGLLETACGQCHIGGASQQPAALEIFDLREADFAARMTDAHLEAMPDRIDGIDLDPQSAAAVLAYVSVVLADRRAAAPPARDC